jgi:hypothetical protein
LTGVTRPRRQPLRRDRTNGAPSNGKCAWPGPPALLPWSPRLCTAVSGAHPRLSGELSPWPPDHEGSGDRSTLCCGCRHVPSRATRPHLRFREAHMYVAVGKFL